MTTQTAYIAIGANLGDRQTAIAHALDLLRSTPGITLVKVSDLIETQPVGGPANSPPYLNGAAELLTTLPPDELLQRLLAIEAQIGRVRHIRWEPRIIDLDLLLVDHQIINTPTLALPHPLMHLRRFVLEPLCQIAPQAIHPTSAKTIRTLLSELV